MKSLMAVAVVMLLGGVAQAVTLQSVYDGTVGNTMNLSAGTTYTGALNITRNMTINGNGAQVTMNRATVERISVGSGLTVTINNLRVAGGFNVVKFGTGSTGTVNGVTAVNLETAVEHDGAGSLTIKSCNFQQLTGRGLLTFGDQNSTVMNIVVENTYIADAGYGLQFEGGTRLRAKNVTFKNVTNAIWTSGARLGTAADRAQIIGCTFDSGNFGANLQAQTFVDVSGCTSLGYRYPFQILNGADVNMTDTLILQNGVTNPSVAVGVGNGAVLRATNCEVTGYMNSFDTSVNGTMYIDGCTMTHPQFSGIICKQNSVTDVRNSTFIDNGQDSIFYGTDAAGSGDTSRGAMENNLSINAGVDNVYGTGIALLGSGPYVVRNNAVVNSLDVGIAVRYGANATIEGNQIVANRKAGIFLRDAGNVTMNDNTIAGHTANGQAGIVVDDSNGALVARRNLLAGNNFGIQFRGTASSTDFQYNFVTRSIKQGVSVTEGRLTSSRSAYIDNNSDYQVYVSSSPQSTFIDSLFAATGTRRGVYTERGSCGGSVSNPTLATGGWWNSSSAPVNRCNGSSSDSRMEYQNATVTGYRSSPHLEVLFTGILNGGSVNTRVPASGGALLPGVSLPAGLANNAFVGIFRPSAGFAEAGPEQSAGLPVHVWTSPALQASSGNVTLQFPDGTGLFAHLDRATGGYDALFTASGTSTRTVVIPASRLANGTWYFVNDSGSVPVIETLLGERSSVGVPQGADLRIDAADL